MAVAAQRGACAVATCHSQEKTAAEEGKTNEHTNVRATLAHRPRAAECGCRPWNAPVRH